MNNTLVTQMDKPQNDISLNTQQTTKIITDILTNLYTSFQTLNNLKHKRNKVMATIDKLTTYKNDGTLPDGLQNVTKCSVILDDDHHKRWVQASIDASNLQLNILLEHHRRKLEMIEHKIQHSTQRIQNNTTTNELAQNIIQTTDRVSRTYSARQLVRNTKSNRGQHHVKRLDKKHHNSNNATITRRLFTTPAQYPNNANNTEPKSTSNERHQRQPNRTFITADRPTPQSTTTVTTNHRPNNTMLNKLITDNIQQQIQNFITPAHLEGYLQHTRKLNRPK